MRYLVLSTLAAAMAVMLCGCQESESESAQIRRARLVGNENLQLKKDLAAKDAEIKQLKKEIEKIEAEKAEQIQKSGDANIKIMKIVLESEQKNAALQAENKTLKAELEKLKKQ